MLPSYKTNKMSVSLQAKANLPEMSNADGSRWTLQACAALSNTSSSQIISNSFFCLLFFYRVPIKCRLLVPLSSCILCLHTVRIEGLWISNELILEWINAMVYSVRVLHRCWKVCWTVYFNLTWRQRKFKAVLVHTHALQHRFVFEHTVQSGVHKCIIISQLTQSVL